MEFSDEHGKIQPVLMGCYGIGPSRVMGTIVEVHHDDKGIIWPYMVAPFMVHLLQLGPSSSTSQQAQKFYHQLNQAGIDVLFDDRVEITAGQKFADADLIGIPLRIVVSDKTDGKFELKRRDETKAELLKDSEVIKKIERFSSAV